MTDDLLALLRCPFCGTRLSLVENDALRRIEGRIDSAVIGCECCAFPVVAGIPVMIADDATRDAMHALEDGRREDALLALLGLDDERRPAFTSLLAQGQRATYQEFLEILSPDAEGAWFIYRFSDPTYLANQALLRALGQQSWTMSGRVLDMCGGTGHLARVLSGMQPRGGVVLADVYFWKLWLAARFTAPECETVCCDGNNPLPLPSAAFSMVVLADAFPYIWHKRMAADELMRAAGPDGVVVLPHLHSALGENFSAGNPLTPAAYQELFAPMRPRLFRDSKIFSDLIERRTVDLSRRLTPEAIGGEAALAVVASSREDLFREYQVPEIWDVAGELKVNPLYRVERRGGASVLTLTFPTPEYEEEFSACRRYMPDTITVPTDLTGPFDRASLGADYEELRRRRVVLDVPARYC